MKFKKIGGSQNHNLFKPHDRDGKVRDVFWVRFSRVGKGRLEESLKTENLTDARIKRDRRIAEFLGEKTHKLGRGLIVDDLFPKWLETKKGKARKTLVSIKLQWSKHLLPFFGGMWLHQVTETEWLRYVNEKRAETPDRKFRNDRIYLAMFLGWCHREGMIEKKPRLEDVDPEVAAGRVLSEKEVEKLLENASRDMRHQIAFAITMGMRKSEILTLEWTQIDWKKKTIHLPAHKTKIRRARTFGMSAAAQEILTERKAESKSKFVFASPVNPETHLRNDGNQTAWDACRERAGIDCRFHDLRHTFLTMAFSPRDEKKKQTVNVALICKYAGLSIDEAMRTYVHMTVEDTRVVASLVEFEVPSEDS